MTNKEMKIGFDLDKIFIDYPPLIPDALINRLYKRKANGILSYRIPSRPERIIRSFSHYYLFRPPIKKNINYVKKLTKSNTHKYYLVSSRFSFLKDRTEDVMLRYRLNKIFDGLYFNFADKQPHVFKNGIIKKLSIDLYADDDLQLLEYLAKNNPKAKFFWLNEKENKPLAKNLFAITRLSEMIP